MGLNGVSPWFCNASGEAAAVVGADRIRPRHRAPQRGALCRVDILVDPYRGVVPSILVLPEIRGYGRILSAPTGAVETMRLQQPTEYTPSASLRSAAFNRGMIATGNHNSEKFAALCNTLSGDPRRLRRSGCQVGDLQEHFDNRSIRIFTAPAIVITGNDFRLTKYWFPLIMKTAL